MIHIVSDGYWFPFTRSGTPSSGGRNPFCPDPPIVEELRPLVSATDALRPMTSVVLEQLVAPIVELDKPETSVDSDMRPQTSVDVKC